ncbi:MAG: hypothetical protein AB8B50_14355 [Pirellulaceae bacterium]
MKIITVRFVFSMTAAAFSILGCGSTTPRLFAQSTYEEPPQAVVDIVDAKPVRSDLTDSELSRVSSQGLSKPWCGRFPNSRRLAHPDHRSSSAFTYASLAIRSTWAVNSLRSLLCPRELPPPDGLAERAKR